MNTDYAFQVIDGHIVIRFLLDNDNHYHEYNIPLDSCKTHEGILKWVIQLGEKNWTDKELIRAFILTAMKENGVVFPIG